MNKKLNHMQVSVLMNKAGDTLAKWFEKEMPGHHGKMDGKWARRRFSGIASDIKNKKYRSAYNKIYRERYPNDWIIEPNTPSLVKKFLSYQLNKRWFK